MAVAVVPVLCWAESPVLDYSLRFGGSGHHDIAGVAVDGDGSVYVAGTTSSAGFPTTNPGIFVTRLSSDGTGIQCSVAIDGASAAAMALGPAGAIYLIGSTTSSNFPITTGPGVAGFTVLFMRLDPCEGKVFSSVSIGPGLNSSPGGLAVDRNGNAVAIVGDTTGNGTGMILALDPDGKRLAAGRISGDARAVAIGRDGSVYVAGRFFVQRLDSTLQSTIYSQPIDSGSGSLAANTVAVDEIGNAFVTCGGVLIKLDPTGRVLYKSYTAAVGGSVFPGAPFGIGVALDASGKVYVATQSTFGLPEVGPPSSRAPFSGVRVRVFAPDGSADEGDLLVPASSTVGLGSPSFVFGFDGERNAVLATVQSAAPVTPGSLSADVPSPISVVKVHYDTGNVPELESDVDLLAFTLAKDKTVNLSASDGSSVPVSAAIVPEIGGTYFSSVKSATTPTALDITANDISPRATTVVFAAPGLRGGFLPIPLIADLVGAFFLTRQDGQLDIPSPSSQQVTANLHLSAVANTVYGQIEAGVSYQAETTAPWLKIGNTTGTTPADLMLTADPSGMATGVYQADITIQNERTVLNTSVTLTIGSVLRITGLPNPIIVSQQSPPATYPIKLISSGSPLGFSVLPSVNKWMEATPTSGITPADITLTVYPSRAAITRCLDTQCTAGVAEGFLGFDLSDGTRYVTSFNLTLVSPTQPIPVPLIPPFVSGSPLAPGGLIHLRSMLSCAKGVSSLPWPTEFGGCSLQVNGLTVPIGSIANGGDISVLLIPGAPSTHIPTIDVLAQLPYTLAGKGTIELSDQNGAITTIAAPGAAASPQLLYLGPPGSPRPWLIRADGSFSGLKNPVRIGEIVSFRISGAGATDPPAPLGDVPSGDTPMRPIARMEAFIDGRRTEVVSVEMSTTEVGVTVVRIRMPEIQPDDHLFILRIAGEETSPAPLRIAP